MFEQNTPRTYTYTAIPAGSPPGDTRQRSGGHKDIVAAKTACGAGVWHIWRESSGGCRLTQTAGLVAVFIDGVEDPDHFS